MPCHIPLWVADTFDVRLSLPAWLAIAAASSSFLPFSSAAVVALACSWSALEFWASLLDWRDQLC